MCCSLVCLGLCVWDLRLVMCVVCFCVRLFVSFAFDCVLYLSGLFVFVWLCIDCLYVCVVVVFAFVWYVCVCGCLSLSGLCVLVCL